MTQRKPTLTELDQLVTQARALTAQECQSLHPARKVKCQLPAGHEGEHRWRYVAGARSHFWTDAGETHREPERRRRRGKFVIVGTGKAAS